MFQLFQDSDFVLYMTSGLDKKPLAHTICRASMVPALDCPAYYAINPIDPIINRNAKGAGTPRASINVTAFRNFLFEIDSLPLETQLELLRYLAPKVPLAQVTFSGGSSYHAIVSVADTLPFKPHTAEGISSYSQAWKALDTELRTLAADYLGHLPARLFDPQCKDPARLSRTPGALRPDTNEFQTPINGFGGFIASDDVLRLMHKHSETSQGISNSAVTPQSETERGRLTKRTQTFINNWSPALATVLPWHPEFIFAVKDLQCANYTFDEARAILSSITGHLDANDMYQMRDVWNRNDFRLDFKPVNSKAVSK